MERTHMYGKLYLYFKNMNKACVPYSLFLLCIFYIHWHARTFISHVEKTLRDFFLKTHGPIHRFHVLITSCWRGCHCGVVDRSELGRPRWDECRSRQR